MESPLFNNSNYLDKLIDSRVNLVRAIDNATLNAETGSALTLQAMIDEPRLTNVVQPTNTITTRPIMDNTVPSKPVVSNNNRLLPSVKPAVSTSKTIAINSKSRARTANTIDPIALRLQQAADQPVDFMPVRGTISIDEAQDEGAEGIIDNTDNFDNFDFGGLVSKRLNDNRVDIVNINSIDKDQALYIITYDIVKNIIRQVTEQVENLETAKDFLLLVVGGSSLNVYLPKKLINDHNISTHDWDLRIVPLNQQLIDNADYLDFINKYRIELVNYMLVTLNKKLHQLRDRQWFIDNQPRGLHDPAVQEEISKAEWLKQNVLLTPFGNYFQLMNTRDDLSALPKDLVTMQCYIKDFGWHSIIDNIVYYPSRAGIAHYDDFLTGEKYQSPTPYVKIDGINYPTLGFILLDTCRMIHKRTPKLNKYLRKFDALIYYLDQEIESGDCQLPIEYNKVLSNNISIGGIYQLLCQKLGEALDLQSELEQQQNLVLADLERKRIDALNQQLINLAGLLSDNKFNQCVARDG